jgi:hypothetical protein
LCKSEDGFPSVVGLLDFEQEHAKIAKMEDDVNTTIQNPFDYS